MDQGAFEVVGREGQWRWQLRDGQTTIAHSADGHDSPEATRERINQFRAHVAVTNGETLIRAGERPEGDAAFRIVERSGLFVWQFTIDDSVVAVPPATYQARAKAEEEIRRIKQLAVGAVPVLFAGSDELTDRGSVPVGFRSQRSTLSTLLRRGKTHREFLDAFDARIVVMGIRGKSSTTRRLADVFGRRKYDTLAKITGNRPHVLHNGEYIPIERGGTRVTLYETIRTVWQFLPMLKSFSPGDVGVFENQGITEYTTRMFNERLVKPDVILLTNVRQDHQDTLGKTRRDIARSFARAVPEGTHVVSGEQHPLLDDYLRAETENVGGTFEQVDVPEEHASLLGAETIHAVNHVLRYFGMAPLPESEVNGFLNAIQPEWTRLRGGDRLFNAAEVNDIESTEMTRRALAGDSPVVPFVYLRGDRRSRTASFVDYVNTLVDRGLVETVYVAGDFTSVFAKRVDAPVVQYGPDADPAVVLDDMLERDEPVVMMGNTVAEFMRQMEEEIERRATRAIHESAEPLSETDAPAEDDMPLPITVGDRTMDKKVGAGGPERDEDAVESLVREVDRRGLSESERKILVEGLDLDASRSVAARVERLESRAAELAAYTDALGRFIDEEGTATDVLADLSDGLDAAEERLDRLETAAADADRRHDDVVGRLGAVEDRLDELSGVREDLAETDRRVGAHDDRLDETERRMRAAERWVADSIGQLEQTVSDNSDRIEALREAERQRLLDEMQAEMQRTDDIDSLRRSLSELRQMR